MSGKDEIREAVLNAAEKRSLKVIEGGQGKPPPPADDGAGDGGGDRPRRRKPSAPEESCPIIPLGQDEEGNFVFLAIDGKQRVISARQLGSRMDVSALFLGDDSWLRKHFPKTVMVKSTDATGAESVEPKVVAYIVANAGEFFMRLTQGVGQFGPHIVIRKPGIWPDAGGLPAVHCGDAVLMRQNWRTAGFREAAIVWPSWPPAPRPGGIGKKGIAIAPTAKGFAAGPDIARQLQEDIRDLWSLRKPGGEIVLIGLVALGYLGAAAPWRSNGFVMGPAESGKSALMTLLRAMTPLHHYTNDTSKAGLEQAVGGRAMTIFVDEASDRVDRRNAEALMDMVLAASGAEGAKGHRGGSDGVGRSISLIGVIIMGAVNPPDMKEQHRRRFSLVELRKAEAGVDHVARVEEITQNARAAAPALWARALDGFDRWRKALLVYRGALARAGCSGGEMDQLGAILAAWWVMTQDGVPDDGQALDGVGGIGEYIRGAEMVARDDAPRRLIQFIASSLIQIDRSTNHEQIGVLVDEAFSDDPIAVPRNAIRNLAHAGIRPVRFDDDKAPRATPGNGLWVAPRAEPLRKLLRGSEFEGDRLKYELLRLPSAKDWTAKNVRVGGYSGPAIWLSHDDWDPPDD